MICVGDMQDIFLFCTKKENRKMKESEDEQKDSTCGRWTFGF